MIAPVFLIALFLFCQAHSLVGAFQALPTTTATATAVNLERHWPQSDTDDTRRTTQLHAAPKGALADIVIPNVYTGGIFPAPTVSATTMTLTTACGSPKRTASSFAPSVFASRRDIMSIYCVSAAAASWDVTFTRVPYMRSRSGVRGAT